MDFILPGHQESKLLYNVYKQATMGPTALRAHARNYSIALPQGKAVQR